MSSWMTASAIYLTPLLLIFFYYGTKKKTRHNSSRQFLAQAQEDGLTEPASMHPVIDTAKCLGCGSCVRACPEHNVLGMIDNKAHLVNPADCIGHGVCMIDCPHDAITLVFGTETRGVDIPELSPEFETNIPGIFIAGELGGMGLIKNAIEQGRQAMDSIVKKTKASASNNKDVLDCLIVGSGPAGLAATLGAMEKKLNVVTIDQDAIGGTVSHFPRGKLVMTAPATMPMVGRVKFKEISKEKLMDFWLGLIEKHSVKINQNEPMLDIQRNSDGSFGVITAKQTYQTKSVLLAIGRRGSPRKLGIDGEELSKVVYRLVDAEQYAGDDVLVVGGGDSALEAACSIAELGSSRVTLSYRSETFGRAKQKNREWVNRLASNDQLRLLMSSTVKQISLEQVEIDFQGELLTLPNSAVIVCAGGVLPSPFLKKIGIEVSTKYGTQ